MTLKDQLPNTTLCVTCGETVVQAANGRVLQPWPHRLGLHHPLDGEVLTQAEIARRLHSTGLAGHATHLCLGGQLELFTYLEAAPERRRRAGI